MATRRQRFVALARETERMKMEGYDATEHERVDAANELERRRAVAKEEKAERARQGKIVIARLIRAWNEVEWFRIGFHAMGLLMGLRVCLWFLAHGDFSEWW